MRTLSEYLKSEYGEKIYKLSLCSGCTCPNRDGSVGTGGCTFCSEGGSGEFAAAPGPLNEQIADAKRRIAAKTDAHRFIAYFQSFTNTYGDPDHLRRIYREAILRDDIAVLSLGTRPDCLGDEIMEMLQELNQIKPVWVELGLQTIHEKTALRINRGYSLPVFEEAVRKLKQAGLQVIVHVILSLPGEDRKDMLETARYLSALKPGIDGIKLQMLNILEGTAMAEEYKEHPFPLLTMEEYAEIVCEMIRILPDDIVIHRLTGDGPGNLLIAPEWVRNKKKVLNTIHRRLRDID
ncbi:MAG: TIGR01212 family radical SAM protein [Solobacterium sp.]|nr:TIGR01212 family radical SAM protein [Solobacterium sp.]